MLCALHTNSSVLVCHEFTYVLPTDYSGLTSEERVLYTLQEQCIPIKMQRLVLAQIKLETGNFKSKLFCEHNNLFGMMYSKKSIALHGDAWAEGRTGYASYASIEDSVLDYVFYTKRVMLADTFTTADSFAKELKSRRYFEADVELYKRNLEFYLKK